MITRDEAWQLLCEYNKEPFHLRHGEVVEGVACVILPASWAMAKKRSFGASWACSMTWILRGTPRSTALKEQEIMGERGLD